MSGPCRFSPPWGVAIPTNAPVTGRRLRPDSLKTVPEPSQSHLDRPKFVPNAGAPVGRATTRGGGYDPVLPILAPLEDLLGWFWDEFERDLGADHLIFHMHVRFFVGQVRSPPATRPTRPADRARHSRQPAPGCLSGRWTHVCESEFRPLIVFGPQGKTGSDLLRQCSLPLDWGETSGRVIPTARAASNATTVDGGTRLRRLAGGHIALRDAECVVPLRGIDSAALENVLGRT